MALNKGRRWVWALLITGIIASGAFAWWALSPLFINNTVSEHLIQATDAPLTVLTEGVFTGADRFHEVTGTASLLEINGTRTVRLQDDFASINGPDLYVWLVKGDNYRSNTLELGKLKGNKGSQNYVLPEGVDVVAYDRVIIWCKAFGVLFGYADLA